MFYDRLTEIAGEYLKNGRPVYIEDRLKTRKWTDRDGAEKYTTEVIAGEMQLLGGREDGGDAGVPAPRSAPVGRNSPSASAPPVKNPATVSGWDDDGEVPF